MFLNKFLDKTEFPGVELSTNVLFISALKLDVL